ncbi:MAG: phenylalanine--tRNA ligase subunit beta [Bacteroidales bacterium]|nr:phenylalanine--tRNA ligase subunit beta [Bacteroidales bacterium]
MKISYNWLMDYLQCDLTPQQVADALTSIGLEVDSLEEVEQIPGGLQGVIVAQVMECTEHPDSDHLHVTKLNTGEGELLQVVCGAPNVAAGQKVLLATVGTVLGEDFKIKKSKIRGVESLGMICAEDELGIGEDHSGIMVLRPDAVPGTPAKEYLNLKTDAVIEIGLTANRVDGASHIGVARDLYAWLKYNGKPSALKMPSVEAFRENEVAGEVVPVRVDWPEAAPKYTATTLLGVNVVPSPQWMQERLLSIGLRPINNIVDVTNFVLMEIGQPLHAFDKAKIEGGRIVVRAAAEGEPFVTLDGVQRTLSAADLMIADEKKPMCLAGIFGGEHSGVSGSTVDVVIESAYFKPAVIRKSSKRHGLKTDAAFRYERGCDPLILEWAAKRAVTLLQEVAGGKVCGAMQKVYSADIARKRIELDYKRIQRFIGKEIGVETIETILDCLCYNFVERRKDAGGTVCGALVEAPSYMIDVERECDVVEEILRIYGYNNIELPARMQISVNPTVRPEPEAVRNQISDFLAANGFVETMNNSLTRAAYYTNLKTFPERACVRILNPLSSDLNVMRQSLIPGGLEVIARNLNHQISSMRLFEYGSVYALKEGADGQTLASYEEHTCYSLLMTGSREKMWRLDAQKGSFFQLKGYLELLLKRLGADVNSLETEAAPDDIFAEGICYKLPGSGMSLAVMGEVNRALLRSFDIKQPVFAAEISWPALFELVKRIRIAYKELPRYPEVKRDLALLVDDGVSYSDLRRSAVRAGKKTLRSVTLFDVYKGDKIPAGKKQYAMSFTLQDNEKTLTDQDVEHVMGKILATLTNEWGAVLR